MVSRDFIKENKKRLEIKRIKGTVLNRYGPPKKGSKRGKKYTLIPNWRMREIRGREIKEIVNIIKDWRFKKQKELIKNRILVADRRHKNKLGVELSSYDLKKLVKIFEYNYNTHNRNRMIIKYLRGLVKKRKKEEVTKGIHKLKHDKLIQKFQSAEQRKGEFVFPPNIEQEIEKDGGLDASNF